MATYDPAGFTTYSHKIQPLMTGLAGPDHFQPKNEIVTTPVDTAPQKWPAIVVALGLVYVLARACLARRQV